MIMGAVGGSETKEIDIRAVAHRFLYRGGLPKWMAVVKQIEYCHHFGK